MEYLAVREPRGNEPTASEINDRESTQGKRLVCSWPGLNGLDAYVMVGRAIDLVSKPGSGKMRGG